MEVDSRETIMGKSRWVVIGYRLNNSAPQQMYGNQPMYIKQGRPGGGAGAGAAAGGGILGEQITYPSDFSADR